MVRDLGGEPPRKPAKYGPLRNMEGNPVNQALPCFLCFRRFRIALDRLESWATLPKVLITRKN
jgi:hypothetical protein